MSGDNPDKNKRESKKIENETKDNTNKTTSKEANTKTDVLLPIDKGSSQSEEVVIDIVDFNSVSDVKTGKNVDRLVDYRASKIKPPQATVVYQVRGQPGQPMYPSPYGRQPQTDPGQPPHQRHLMMEQHATYGDPLEYDPESRNGFIRLVFSIVLIMIIVTAVFVAAVLMIESLTDFFLTYGTFIGITAAIMMIGLNYAVMCSACTRIFPCNIVILILAVIGMSLICGFITVRYDTQIVLFAVLATSVVIFICILVAYSSFDFTKWMIYVVVIAAAFSAIFMICMITMMLTGTYMKLLHVALLIISTIINVIVIIMELQMILGGRAVEIGEEDYALAAFLLYTSIVDVFIKMVQILGICDSM